MMMNPEHVSNPSPPAVDNPAGWQAVAAAVARQAASASQDDRTLLPPGVEAAWRDEDPERWDGLS